MEIVPKYRVNHYVKKNNNNKATYRDSNTFQ